MRKHLGLAALLLAAAAGGFVAGAQDTVDVAALPFSAARAAGNTLFVSGQIPVRDDGSVVEGSVTDQTHQTMKNLEAALAGSGYTWDDVVKVSVFLSDMKHYQEMNAAYRTYFKNGFPARECVGGLQLAFGADLEISCIAYKK